MSVRFNPLIFEIMQFSRLRAAAMEAEISRATKPHLHRFDLIVH
jgi:hypothetical protein